MHSAAIPYNSRAAVSFSSAWRQWNADASQGPRRRGLHRGRGGPRPAVAPRRVEPVHPRAGARGRAFAGVLSPKRPSRGRAEWPRHRGRRPRRPRRPARRRQRVRSHRPPPPELRGLGPARRRPHLRPRPVPELGGLPRAGRARRALGRGARARLRISPFRRGVPLVRHLVEQQHTQLADADAGPRRPERGAQGSAPGRRRLPPRGRFCASSSSPASARSRSRTPRSASPRAPS